MSGAIDNRTARSIIRAARAGAPVSLLAEVHEVPAPAVRSLLASVGVKPRPDPKPSTAEA